MPGTPLRNSRRGAQPRIRLRPTEVVSADELESIHVASLRVLEEIGMDFLDAGARDAAAGRRRARGARQRSASASTRDMVAELIRTAPVAVHAPRPQPGPRHRSIGGTGSRSGPSASAPNVADLDRGRRVGNRVDYQNLLRLAQMLNAIHFLAGYPVEPIDLHRVVRHLRCHLRRADPDRQAVPLLQPRPPAQHRRLEMVRIARGIDDADARPRAVDLHGHQLAARRCGSTRRCSRASSSIRPATRSSCMTPFTLAGAMAPVTLAGALAEQNAEALAGMVADPGRPARARRSSTAASPRTSTCSRARRRSGRRSTCGRR